MSAPVDVEAIRAEFAEACDDAGLSSRYRIADRIPAICDALEHERRVSAAWKALAVAYADSAGPSTEQIRAAENDGSTWATDLIKARAALRAIGIDPEAP